MLMDDNGGGDSEAVYIAIDVGIDQDIPCRILCNRAVNWVPGVVVRTNGLESEGVRFILYSR